MHETVVAARAMIAAFYGQAPRLSYYSGCSTGGRQGLMEAQRYPDDFDAIVAGAPVNNMIHLNESQVALHAEMLKDPARIVPPEKVALFARAVLAACDAKDGVRDGIVSDPNRCTFDPATLACKGADAPNCLTAPQVESARRAYAPVTTKSGALVYPGRAPGFESGYRIPAAGAPINPLFGDMPHYIGNDGTAVDPLTFDLDSELARAMQKAGFIEATDPNLAKFKARGGKLILYHGWADPGPAPANTISYASEVSKALGGAPQNDWLRLFLLPGVGHCGGGPGADQADFVAALERWRESNVAPDRIEAAHVNGGRVSMTRPLCPYPQVAQFKGAGSSNDASNFVCK
jgi:feruloyl esterase